MLAVPTVNKTVGPTITQQAYYEYKKNVLRNYFEVDTIKYTCMGTYAHTLKYTCMGTYAHTLKYTCMGTYAHAHV
jgi:hypothetical protein